MNSIKQKSPIFKQTVCFEGIYILNFENGLVEVSEKRQSMDNSLVPMFKSKITKKHN
jgi:hypothetical protein